MSQYDYKAERGFEGVEADQSSELDQMHQEFKEFQKQQALKREREAQERNAGMGQEQASMSSHGQPGAYQPPHVRNPDLSRSLQMDDEVNQSKGGQILPLQEENLQNQFIKEPKSSAKSKESPEITDNYLFQQRENENVSRDLEQSVKPFDARGPAPGEKEHLSFGDQRMSEHQQPAMRGSKRDLADPFPNEERHSLRSGRRTNDHEDSQHFGAMQNADDRQRLEDFMRGDSTSLSKANRSFADDVQRENSVKEFAATKRPASRAGSRAGSGARGRSEGRAGARESERSSRRSSRRSVRGGDAEPPVEIDRIVVEKSPRKERASKKSPAGSRGRQSVNDSKLYERAGSMSSIGKGSSNAKESVPFVDEKLSNINDTRMSNALQPRRNQDNNQSISVLANVFDQIDPTNPKDSVKKINDSLYDINNDSRMSNKHGENSKENEYGTPLGNDTGNFALQNSNNSKSHQNSGLGGSQLHNQSRGTRGSHSKQPDHFYEPEARETFNPNDYEKLRVDQSLEQQIREQEQPPARAPQAVRSRPPTEDEIQNMDKDELDRLMEARMDAIMAQQRRVPQPTRKADDQLRHQTPFFARDDETPGGQQVHPADQQPPYPTQHSRHLSNSKKERPPPTPSDHQNNFSMGHNSRGGLPMEEASIQSIDQESLNVQTPQQSLPEEPNMHGQFPQSTPKEGSASDPSQYSTDHRDKERYEEFRAWQQKKNEEMQLKKNDYFSRHSGSEADRAPSRRGPMHQPEYEQRPQQRINDSFSNNSQAINEAMPQPDNVSHQNYRQEPSSGYHPPVVENQRPAMAQPENYPTHYSQADLQSPAQQVMPMLHPQRQVYPQQQAYQGVRSYQPPAAGQHPASASGRAPSNTRGDFQPLKSAGPADPWTPQQPASQAESTMNLTRNSSVGSRMSRAGRAQRYADGRQSRSTSRGDKHASEISAVSIIKSPRVNRPSSRDVSLDIKRKKMAEDMAKAQEAQRQLEEMAKRKRQDEQRKLFHDIGQTKFAQQVLPSQKSRPYNRSRSRHRQGDSDADDFGDDEFNDIDEGTIKAGGPQNHRRVRQNQGPLNQRNAIPSMQDSPDDDNNTLDTRRQLHRGNNRGVKILQISDIDEKRQPSPKKDQRVVNGRFGPTIVNVQEYNKPKPYATEPQKTKQGGTGSPFYGNNYEDNFSHRTSDSRTQQILPVQSFQGNEQQRRQRANDDLFNRVMREKDPKQALNQFVMKDRNAFDMYKDSMAELNTRIDRELSRVHRQSNVADRLIDQQRARDQNLQKYQDHINQQRRQDEMRECTFTPKIGHGPNGEPQRTNSRTRQASPAQFVKSEQAFIQRKQNWIHEQNMKQEQEFQKMQQTKFVNEGSRKILDGRRGSNASGSNGQPRQQQSRADSRASNRSGSRSEALNDVLNRSQEGKFKFFNNGQKKRGDSRAGSNASGRSGSNSRSRAAGLAQYSGVEKRQPGNSSKSPSRVAPPTTAAATDNYLTMQLHREYQDIIQHHVYERGSLHIEDILQDMGFIDERIVSNQRTRLGIMLRQQRNNLLLCNSQGAVMSEETEEITQNLFRILCSIMNLKQTPQIYQQLDQNLLNSYLTYIDLNKEDQDILILEQLATIKSLINRQPYSLNDNQVLAIHKKFSNLFNNRKSSIENTKKLAFESRVADQNKGMFKPQIDFKSAQYKPQASVYDRSQEFHKLPDRDPRDVEYEQQQQHCTFKPMTNKGRPWQGNRPPSRAGSGVRGPGSQGRGERPQSGASGTNNTSITRQRFGPTVHTQTTKRNDSGARVQQMPGNLVRKASPGNFVPSNQYVNQPSKAMDPEPFSESDPSFKQTYLNKKVSETESSLSLNPQKFHDRQNKQRMQQQHPNQAEPTATEDPDTYIGARETYKDEVPQMLRTPSQSVHSYTRVQPRVQPQQTPSLNRSNASNAIPNELIQSNTQAQRYEQEPQFNGNEPVDTNSMVNDSFGPATNDQVMANYLPPSSNMMPPQSNFPHDNNSHAVNPRYLAQDPSTKQSQPAQSVENETTLQQSPDFKSPRDARVPICVLKIELDRQNVEEIRVYDGEDPTSIVNQFGHQFDLTEGAMVKLHQQIIEQIQINRSKGGRSRHQVRR